MASAYPLDSFALRPAAHGSPYHLHAFFITPAPVLVGVSGSGKSLAYAAASRFLSTIRLITRLVLAPEGGHRRHGIFWIATCRNIRWRCLTTHATRDRGYGATSPQLVTARGRIRSWRRWTADPVAAERPATACLPGSGPPEGVSSPKRRGVVGIRYAGARRARPFDRTGRGSHSPI